MIKYLSLRQTFRKLASLVAQRTGPSSIVISTVWQVVEKIFRLCAAFASGILVARYLQPELYGLYNYAIAFTSFFVAVSSLGTSQFFVRELVKNPESNKEIVNSALTLRVLSGALFSLLAIGLSFFLGLDALVRSLVVIFSLRMIFKSSEAIEFFFESRSRYKSITLSKSIASILSTLLIAVSIARGEGIQVLAIASCSEHLASLIAILVAYLFEGQVLSLSFISLPLIKKVLSNSWPLIFSGIAITIYVRIDQIMINSIAGSTELGLYSVAVQATEAFYLIPIAFIKSNFPEIIRSENNKEAFYRSLQKMYNKISFMSYLSILFVSVFSHGIITTLYGTAYDEAISIINLLIWSVLFVSLGVARSKFIISMNLTKVYLKTVIIASAVNISLNFILIPNYGAFGAAIATVFSYWVAAHGSCFLFRSLYKTGNMLTKSLVLLS